MAYVPLVLQLLAIVCLAIAAFDKVDSLGWVGIALFIAGFAWVTLREVFKF